jgi:hypothetical protein
MSAALHIALKDLLVLSRDRVALFWVLAFPLLFSLFFGAVLRAGLDGQMSPLGVVVVSESSSAAAQRLIASLEKSAALDVRRGELESARCAAQKPSRSSASARGLDERRARATSQR